MPAKPVDFQRAMVFVDGTNLFARLAGAKLRLTRQLAKILQEEVGGRQIVRIYLYTVQRHLDRAIEVHGEARITTGIRMVLGHDVPTSGGHREKGVDALLVADLVYHAAVRNLDYAVVVTADTDFQYAIRRVEDFGCRTAVLTFCAPVPQGLREGADSAKEIASERLLRGSAEQL